MTAADEAPPATPADERRRARLAQIEAEQAHGERLVARYGREDGRQRFASVGRVDSKLRRRR